MPSAQAGGPSDLSRFASQPVGAHPYRRTWRADGGWYAEGRYRERFPLQLAYGATKARALANLDNRFAVWIY